MMRPTTDRRTGGITGAQVSRSLGEGGLESELDSQMIDTSVVSYDSFLPAEVEDEILMAGWSTEWCGFHQLPKLRSADRRRSHCVFSFVFCFPVPASTQIPIPTKMRWPQE